MRYIAKIILQLQGGTIVEAFGQDGKNGMVLYKINVLYYYNSFIYIDRSMRRGASITSIVRNM